VKWTNKFGYEKRLENIKRINKHANNTTMKYQNEITDCRKKIGNLLMKAYSQQEIVSKLYSSQSTVFRDIALLYNQTERKTHLTSAKLHLKNYINLSLALQIYLKELGIC
jgi:hypothetical protein